MIDMLVISHACFSAINRNIYRLFAKDGINVEIVAPTELNFPNGRRKADPPSPQDPVVHYLSLVGDNPRIYFFEGLLKLLDDKKPAVVLLDNDPVSRMAIQTGRWCKRNNATLFCISNENLPLDLVSTVKRRGIRSLPPALYKRMLLMRSRRIVDGIFAINSDGKRIFLDEGFRKVERMPLGFDPFYFHIDHEKRTAIKHELQLHDTTIAYFGRLIPEKGVHLLIDALSRLKKYPWHLLMDHFDEYASAYNQQIQQLIERSGLADRIVYVSPNHFEIGAFMNAADVVVVPSVSAPNWKEQYGRVAAEAMACGRLVIASDSGALPELLNGHGLLFKEGDIDELTSILEKLLTGTLQKIPTAEEISTYAHAQLSMQKQLQVMKNSFVWPHHKNKVYQGS